MQFFKYKAKDTVGKTKVGVIEAPDIKQAVNTIREHGLTVISISAKSDTFSLDKIFSNFAGVGGGERTVFTRMLSTMLTSGLPLSDALSNLKSQASSAKLKDVIDAIVRDVQGGTSLSAAMGRHPDVFNQLYVSLVRAGEASGNLDKSLVRLADTMEKDQEFKSKVKGAMIYPIIVIVAMGGVAAVMMVVVIPKITVVYKEFGADLPLPTMILMVVSNFFIDFWWLMILGGIFFMFIFRAYKKTKTGEYLLNNLSFKIPIIGALNREVTLATFSRTLGTLIGSGIAILDALKIVSDTIGHNVYRKAVEDAAKQVEKGFPLSFPLRTNPLFPTIVSQLVAVGEETGSLDQSLERLAAFFESGAERKVKTLTTALEPLLIIIMGLGVGGLAIAVLLPMFNLVNVIK